MKRNAKNLRKYKKFVHDLWRERGMHTDPRCEKTGVKIGVWDSELGEYVPRFHNVSHGDKGRRSEEDCLDPDNIEFLSFEAHSKEHKLSVKNSEWMDS